MSDRPTPGQVAYEQYCRSRHAGTVLLPWALLAPALREAWEAAAAAVLAWRGRDADPLDPFVAREFGIWNVFDEAQDEEDRP